MKTRMKPSAELINERSAKHEKNQAAKKARFVKRCKKHKMRGTSKTELRRRLRENREYQRRLAAGVVTLEA